MWKQLLFLLLLNITRAFSASPCNGRFLLVLDQSVTWNGFSSTEFNDQKELVKNLLSPPYFDHFERLALGGYEQSAYLTNFGDCEDQSDVADFLNQTKQEQYASCLVCALNDIKNHRYFFNKMTIVIFVSFIDEYDVRDARELAKQLQDQGARLVLIGHGKFTNEDWISIDRLSRITGDPSAVFKWDDGKSLPADDYHQWFKQVLDC
ncbi:hypothetical protein M3Y94_00020600 [Aphelenchoides besseyi]|nr:hypothetical protein M3Y94_00020600 [Aphelenchoides besseyi]KAI6217054.1 hypothetical protein M3Y95_01240900 [Aphelenchoides besseyi]